jgi:hypothetical protein
VAFSAYILQRPACSERCKLDLPFKNLEGLHIGMFLAYRQVRDCQDDDNP